MTIVSFADLPVRVWANGGGRTVELARHPAEGPFEWRLSIATVSDDTAFSHLAEVDRVLMPLSAGGLTLRFDEVPRHLDRFETVAFPGEQAIRPLPPAAPTMDLNLMVRRGTGVPAMRTVTVEQEYVPADGLLAVVVLDGDLERDGHRLGFGDTVLAPFVGAAFRGRGVIALAAR